MPRTKFLPVGYSHWIPENSPSAGPNCSVRGMKKLFWGEDAYCVRCGQYVYKVPKYVWEKAFH